MSESELRLRGGASAACMGLSLLSATEVFVYFLRVLMCKRTRSRAKPSLQSAALGVALGFVPTFVWAVTGCSKRASAAAVLISVLSHFNGRLIERSAGVVCSRLVASGSTTNAATLCLFCCMGDFRVLFVKSYIFAVLVLLFFTDWT